MIQILDFQKYLPAKIEGVIYIPPELKRAAKKAPSPPEKNTAAKNPLSNVTG